MWGVGRALGVRSMQAKVEERVLRWMGHVLNYKTADKSK